jgi:hypothetical protein
LRAVLVFSAFEFILVDPPRTLICILLSSYELQVSQSVQRGGIGKILMKCLYDIARGWKMQKVMLTVFKGDDTRMYFELSHTQSYIRRESSSILILQGCGVCAIFSVMYAMC